MCGIAGFVNIDDKRPRDAGVLQRMTRTLQHRGPDGEGYFVSDRVNLGHRRLAIIDLNTGDQPMHSSDGQLTIVFNGEIYNYVELRQELVTRGHHFRTSSDTEVILAAYREWGTRCVARFNGMWAFALWDANKRRLFCSRDRMGEKPFYYAVTGGAFVFGSEIKALFAYGVPKSVNTETLDAYLCFTFVPGKDTFFKGVYKLQPAHSITLENGEIRDDCYWEWEIADELDARRDESQILEEFESLFKDAVSIRTRCDVPFGAFLSGGLDSGCIVAIMSSLSSTPVITCTMGFENAAFDERPLARLVARKFRTDHIERIVKSIDIDQLLSKLAWHYDEPFGDSSALPTYLVSKIARERVTVALTGDGGDEVTSGYSIHVGEKIARLYGYFPKFLRDGPLLRCISLARHFVPAFSRPKLARLRRVTESCGLDFIDRLESKQTGLTRVERSTLIPSKGVRPARDYIAEAIEPVKKKDNFAKLNYWLMKAALPDDMLCKVDRASMANSLETRAPFLDYRIVELLGRTSMRTKLNGFQRKTVLRKTVAKQLPAELLSASKRGFAVPLHEWLRDGALNQIEQRALRAANGGFLCLESLKNILTAYKSGDQDSANAIWALGMLAGHVG